MGIVIELASVGQRSPSSPTLPTRAGVQPGFTLRDRADLESWSAPGRRVALCSSEAGPFAMLYQQQLSWASWGVLRQGRQVLLWNCVTLADIGRFSSMFDALAAIAAGVPVSTPAVLMFAAAQQFCATVV